VGGSSRSTPKDVGGGGKNSAGENREVLARQTAEIGARTWSQGARGKICGKAENSPSFWRGWWNGSVHGCVDEKSGSERGKS